MNATKKSTYQQRDSFHIIEKTDAKDRKHHHTGTRHVVMNATKRSTYQQQDSFHRIEKTDAKDRKHHHTGTRHVLISECDEEEHIS